MERPTLILHDRLLADVKRAVIDRGETISARVDEVLADGLRRAQAPKRRAVSLPSYEVGEARVDVADRNHLIDFMERG